MIRKIAVAAAACVLSFNSHGVDAVAVPAAEWRLAGYAALYVEAAIGVHHDLE